MNGETFAIFGDILYSREDRSIAACPGHYLVCSAGEVAGVFEELPEKYGGIAVEDARGRLVIPGLVDLHLHAPQYAFRGLGMDLELLDWLQTHTFPEEAKYAGLDYARRAYGLFVMDLARGATTRAAVFATVHVPATLLLMEMLEDSGLVTMVGKVNMDRNCADDLREADAGASLAATRAWLERAGGFDRTRPILTPRFVPSCSDALMAGLGSLQRETGLPVQSHLSESLAEVEWVRQLCPGAETYADAYACHGLLGGEGCPTVMAHCVHSEGREMEQLARQGVFVAHSPVSNGALASGVAPVRTFLENGVKVGLATDVAGGFSLSMFRVMADAVSHSKLRGRLLGDGAAPLTLPEVFHMATRGGGAFFGKVGAFEPGYAFDALVLDDSSLPCPFELTAEQRLERLVYLGGDGCVRGKYVAGRRIL